MKSLPEKLEVILDKADLVDNLNVQEDVLQRSIWVHSCPAWIAGPRSAHPKFGGGITIGGIQLVEDRLRAIKERFPDDLSSGHNFLEVRVGGSDSRRDHPNAIGFNDLVHGIYREEFPRWSAMTNPCFGLRGVENGGILNPDPKIVEMCRRGHILAIKRSAQLLDERFGFGYTIWWPAFDSRLHRGPLSQMGWEEGRKKLKKFWVSVLRKTNGKVWLEYKPSVPGQLDFFPTMKAAIDFCNEVNNELGRKAMFINLEWAHALIGGQTVRGTVK